jgi:hypothetical protein
LARLPLVWRRSAAAAGIYLSIGFGFLATVLTKRQLDNVHFGLLSAVIVSASFFQTLLDFTAEEALIKYGFDYTTAGDWDGCDGCSDGARDWRRGALATVACSSWRRSPTDLLTALETPFLSLPPSLPADLRASPGRADPSQPLRHPRRLLASAGAPADGAAVGVSTG